MIVTLAVLVAGWGQATATASDLVFHSGGRAHPLVRSETEYGVEMAPQGAAIARARLAAEPNCTLEALSWSPQNDRICIARVTKADRATQVQLRSIAGVRAVQPVYRFDGSEAPLLSTGTVVLRLRTGLTQAQRESFFREFRVGVEQVIDPVNHVYRVRPQGDIRDGDVRTAMAMFRDDRTRFAHPDFIVPMETRQILTQVEDEFFGMQWHLNNIGQGLGTPGADINVADAWEVTFGEDITLGIFDDSVDVAHEDLAPNYTGFGQDVVRAQEGPLAPNPLNFDDNHGTAVIGLAAADGNDRGVRGVAPASRFTASRGLLDGASLSQVSSAYTFARQQEVDIHIDSWGFPFARNSEVDAVVDAIDTAYNTGRNGLGMVIVFASGNQSEQHESGDDLSTLASVIGVGATNADDQRVPYSNFSPDLDVMAPSQDDPLLLPGMVTTDVTDSAGFASLGYNFGGVDIFGFPDLTNPQYTKNFGGTSASCPVAAGVAALLLSRNQNLTADQVRVVMTQTCEKVDPLNAGYHPITERSLSHGYGRVNAGLAVEAASESRNNGGLTWPEPLRTLRLSGSTIIWTNGDRVRQVDHDDDMDTPSRPFGDTTVRTLVVESMTPYSALNAFLPVDGAVYEVNDEAAPGITVKQNENKSSFTLPGGAEKRYYALFPANAIGRFAFGATVDTDGNVEGIAGLGSDDGGGGAAPIIDRPQVSIRVTPLTGQSPLDISFRGNALTEAAIASMMWDFGDGETSTSPVTTHRYTAAGTETERFFASYTVTDEVGNTGTRTIAVDVLSTGSGSGGDSEIPDIRIVITAPGSVTDNSTGIAPFAVELNLAGDPVAGVIESITWDLGDGAMADTISVPHIYQNDSGETVTLPVSVRVITRMPDGNRVTQSATRFITVMPNPDTPGNTNGNDNGNGIDNGNNAGGVDPRSGACGAGAPLALSSMLCLALIRRRLR